MELNENQSALILEIDDHGEIFVEVASSDHGQQATITTRDSSDR